MAWPVPYFPRLLFKLMRGRKVISPPHFENDNPIIGNTRIQYKKMSYIPAFLIFVRPEEQKNKW